MQYTFRMSRIGSLFLLTFLLMHGSTTAEPDVSLVLMLNSFLCNLFIQFTTPFHVLTTIHGIALLNIINPDSYSLRRNISLYFATPNSIINVQI
jgi:hypothetical protein